MGISHQTTRSKNEKMCPNDNHAEADLTDFPSNQLLQLVVWRFGGGFPFFFAPLPKARPVVASALWVPGRRRGDDAGRHRTSQVLRRLGTQVKAVYPNRSSRFERLEFLGTNCFFCFIFSILVGEPFQPRRIKGHYWGT